MGTDERKIEVTKNKPSEMWNAKVLIAIPGFMFISGAISALQNIAKSVANDIDNVIFVANWMSWIAALFLALGWFATHWLEIALSKNQIRIAKLLFASIPLGGILITVYFQFFTQNEVLHRFGITSMFLISSGYFLRYSMFQNENLLRVKTSIFRLK